jgi:hypothetical protein
VGEEVDLVMAWHVTHWETDHESAESRKYKKLPYLRRPAGHQGWAFAQLRKEGDRAELYGVWNVILNVANHGEHGARGWLVRKGRELTARDLEDLTQWPAGVFERALEFFARPDVGWLEDLPFPAVNGESPGVPDPSPDSPGESPGVPESSQKKQVLQYSTLHNSTGKRERESVAPLSAEGKLKWVAITRAVKELTARKDELTEEERAELRQLRANLRTLEKQQREAT